IVALVAAGTVGRIGRLLPGQSTALIALLGFVAFALVPFLKYPSTPPAVGDGETIGDRTALYFGFVLLSVVVAVAATYLAVRLRDRIGTYGGVVAGAGVYLVVMVVAVQVFATVNEVGDFPADALWFFRRSSLFTLATMWAVIGVVLTGLVSRLYAAETAAAERRELAVSLCPAAVLARRLLRSAREPTAFHRDPVAEVLGHDGACLVRADAAVPDVVGLDAHDGGLVAGELAA